MKNFHKVTQLVLSIFFLSLYLAGTTVGQDARNIGNFVTSDVKSGQNDIQGTSTAIITATDKGQKVGGFTHPYSGDQVDYWAGTFKGTVDGSDARFYCIDINHGLAFNEDYTDEGPTSSEITYILNNYYPYKSFPYSGSLSTESKEASAIQVTIWHYADGLDLNTIGDAEVKARALDIMADADANAGDVNTASYFVITPPSQTITMGSTANFTVVAYNDSNVPVEGVNLTVSTTDGTLSTTQLVTDANGVATFTLSQGSGNYATVTVNGTITIPHGTRYWHVANPDGRQKLVLATPAQANGTAEASVEWYSTGTGTELCAFDNDGIKQTLGTLYISTLSNGDVNVRLTYSKDFNDNTYDDNSPGNTIGWPGGNHKFDHLAKSDKVEFEVFDGNGSSIIHFDLDYLEKNQNSYPSTYGPRIENLYSGNVSDLVSFNSSLSRNFNDYNYVLTTQSPATDANYTPNPNYPNWDYNVTYEFTISASAFGSAGFGNVQVVSMHNSPSKLNFDNKVYPFECGSVQKASIGDKVWYDTNQNGIQDSGELGIEGVTVKLYDCDNNFILSVDTDANGEYLFSDLTPGDYYVQFLLPSGYVFSPQNVGNDDAVDSDADELTGKTECTTLDGGENDLTWDAGMYECDNSIGDFVWHDANVNGLQDAGEEGIENVIIKLLDENGDFLNSTTTDANGFYSFTGLPNGTYTVKVASDNFGNGGALQSDSRVKWYMTLPNQGDDALDSDGSEDQNSVTVTLSCSDNQTIDFGFFKSCVSLEKTGPATVNAGDTITYNFRIENCGDVVLHGGASVYDPLINPNGDHQIWWSVVEPGEVFEFTKEYTTTDNDCGTLVNTATAVGHPRYPDGTTLPNVTDESTWNVEVICEQPASIGDKVWYDDNENGIQDNGEAGEAGITVNLYDCNDTFIATMNTDGNGNYLFDNLTPGDYYVEFVLPNGYVFSPKNQGSDDAVDSDADETTGKTDCTTLESGEVDLTWDAGIYQSKSAIGDYVWYDANENGIQEVGESGIEGVTVNLYTCDDVLAGTTTTDVDGFYMFDNLNPGDYYVEFILPSGYVFSPQDQGGNNDFDSDADETTGKTICTSLVPGEYDMSWDAGMYEPQPDEADLEIIKTVNNQNPDDGDVITYTIKVKNNGPADAEGVVVTDLLPSGVIYQSSSASQGNYDEVTGLWTIGSIANGANATLTITAEVDVTLINGVSWNLGPASDYNLFVLYDVNQPSSDTEGRVAVGRNAYFANYSIGDKLSAGSGDVLVVGKNLTYVSGAVYNGNVVYGNSTNLPQTSVSITGGTLRQDNPIDFAAARSYLTSLSSQLKTLAANGTTTFQWGGLVLSGTDPFLNIFFVDGNDLSAANNMSINVPSGSVVLVNINRNNLSWSGGLSITGTTKGNVLFNFYKAKNLAIHNIDIRGSVLAPFAKVNFSTGVINGQMVAKFLEGAGQFNNTQFIGNLPQTECVTNIAEISASLLYDPDSTPNNGDDSEDDYDEATFCVSSGGSGGSGGGSGDDDDWTYVGSFDAGQIVWSLTYDANGNMYAGTWGGKIYMSADGENWSCINEDMTVGFIWALRAYNGFVFAGTEQGIFKYDGSTWVNIGLEYKDVRTIEIDANGVLYAGTWGFGVFVSTDLGLTWTESNTGLGYMLAIQAMTVTSNGVYVGSVGGGISSTTDNGASWQKLTCGYDFIWSMASTSTGTVFAGTYGDGLYKSTDGVTFTKCTDLTAAYVYAITVDAQDNIYISSWEAGVFMSEDGGTTWESLGMGGFGVSSILVNLSGNKSLEGTIYAGTSDGKLYKKVPNGVTSYDDETEIDVPKDYALDQNYPNPFNPTTQIQFAIPVAGNYQLKVYNIIGQEVATLVNGEVAVGFHSVTFDATKLASGIYIYRLSGNNVNITRKMILMK